MVREGGAVPDNAGTEAEAIVDSFEEELWYDASKITDMLLRTTIDRDMKQRWVRFRLALEKLNEGF